MNALIAYPGVVLPIMLLGIMVMMLSQLVFLVPCFNTFMRSLGTQLTDAYLDKYPEAFAH